MLTIPAKFLLIVMLLLSLGLIQLASADCNQPVDNSGNDDIDCTGTDADGTQGGAGNDTIDIGSTATVNGDVDGDNPGSGNDVITNDGELANRLTHPRYGVEKEYLALLDREPDEKQIERLRKGVFIEGGKTSPAKVERARQGKGGAALRIAIHEGRNRQVRLMCQAVGLRVKDLKRTRIGFLRSTGLRPGECRMLGQEEAKRLRTAVGL